MDRERRLAGLIGAIVLLLGLSPFVFKAASWTRGASAIPRSEEMRTVLPDGKVAD